MAPGHEERFPPSICFFHLYLIRRDSQSAHELVAEDAAVRILVWLRVDRPRETKHHDVSDVSEAADVVRVVREEQVTAIVVLAVAVTVRRERAWNEPTSCHPKEVL